jgi:ADP-heptose:LPS heptosyltransferase
MNVSLARKLDYYLGVPACFLLSMAHIVKRLILSENGEDIKPKKIMFLELSEMGSAILAYPAMEKTKEMYPEAVLYFWIFSENQDSVRILDLIPEENIIVMRSKNFWYLLIDMFRNLRRVKKEGIDVVIDLELFSRFTSILTYLSAAKIRVGFYRDKQDGLYRGGLHTHKVTYDPHAHISVNFLSLTNSLIVSRHDISLPKEKTDTNICHLPKFKIEPESREKIYKKLQLVSNSFNEKSAIILINLGTDDRIPLREWPAEYYSDLVRRILEKENTSVIFIGRDAPGRVPFSNETSGCINLIGKTTIKELLSLFQISRVVVSHDCGIAHIASLTDIHTIVLFGPETPVLYGPLTDKKTVFYKNFACSPCLSAYNQKKSPCQNNKCMWTITVDEVYSDIKKALK